MIKSDLIARVSKANPQLPPHLIELVINSILDEIASALCHGGRVELRNFGVFSTRLLGARRGRNPKTGEPLIFAEKRMAHFKPGKGIHAKLNENSNSVE